MKKYIGCVIFFGITVSWLGCIFAAAEQASVVDVIMLPGSHVVSVKLPNSTEYIKIHSIRSIPEGTKISADHPSPVNILCPGIRLFETSPGETVSCPEPDDPDIQLIAQASPPPPPPLPPIPELSPIRGPDEEPPLVGDMEQQLQETQRLIQTLSIALEERQFLRAWIYESSGFYREAISYLETIDSPENPAILRFLGVLYIKTGSDGYRKSAWYFFQAAERSQAIGDIEGQAVAHHYISMLAAALGDRETAQQEAEKAIGLYQQLGYAQPVEFIQKLLETL